MALERLLNLERVISLKGNRKQCIQGCRGHGRSPYPGVAMMAGSGLVGFSSVSVALSASASDFNPYCYIAAERFDEIAIKMLSLTSFSSTAREAFSWMCLPQEQCRQRLHEAVIQRPFNARPQIANRCKEERGFAAGS